MNGTKYQVPCAIVIGKNDELEFGRVVSIYVDDSIVFFFSFPRLHVVSVIIFMCLH